MKKTLKTVVSLLVSLIIALTPLCSFAADESETVKWYDSEYSVSGTFTEGENTVTVQEPYCAYYKFVAEKPGYYTVSYPVDSVYYIDCSDTVVEEGVVYGYRESIDKREDDCYLNLYYFEASEYYIFVNIIEFSEDKEFKINIEYFGEAVTQLDFEGGYKYALIPDYNIDYKKYIAGSGHKYNIDAGMTTATFDSGKTFETYRFSFNCVSDKKMENGSYDIKVKFFNDTFDKTVSVKPITEEITDIKITNIENYTDVSFGYDGCLVYDFNEMELVLTYADGHTETLNPEGDGMGIDLLNGNPHYIYLGWGYVYDDSAENKDVKLVVTLGDHNYIEVPCNVTDTSRKTNRGHYYWELTEVLTRIVTYANYDLEDIMYEFESVESPSFYERLVLIRKAFSIATDMFIELFENFALETKLYQKNTSLF